MVQMRRCSDHKKLRDSVDLFNVFQSLAFEEMEPIITGCQSYWQTQDNKRKIYKKSSKTKFIKLRVNGKFYLKKSIFSFSIIVFMF